MRVALAEEFAGIDGVKLGERPDPVPAAVISVPDGATSHHLAPKPSTPWPRVCPAPESPAK